MFTTWPTPPHAKVVAIGPFGLLMCGCRRASAFVRVERHTHTRKAHIGHDYQLRIPPAVLQSVVCCRLDRTVDCIVSQTCLHGVLDCVVRCVVAEPVGLEHVLSTVVSTVLYCRTDGCVGVACIVA